ncbi:MAG: P1 family peptidase [Bacteroidota bacterium]
MLGLSVGHYTDREALTGCTVVLTPQGAVAGVSVRGAAPGSRELALLEPGRLIERVHAVLITGGSAFGLAAADGVMRWLEEREVGFDAGPVRVPIVPAAVLFDLGVGDPTVRPGAEAGYAACEAARAEGFETGRVGAGTGATVGKILGPAGAMPGGLGTASVRVAGTYSMSALVAVNAMGDVIDGETIIAGAQIDGTFVDTARVLMDGFGTPQAGQNTTIGVVATDAPLTKSQCRHLADMAHDGLARSIRPVHTLYDGDTLFALSTAPAGTPPVPPDLLTALGTAAAEVVARAVRAGVAE